MAVTNLHKPQKDHASRIGRFALDAVKAAEATLVDVEDPQRGGIKLRVGFHTGSVVANVVGTKNPRCASARGEEGYQGPTATTFVILLLQLEHTGAMGA